MVQKGLTQRNTTLGDAQIELGSIRALLYIVNRLYTMLFVTCASSLVNYYSFLHYSLLLQYSFLYYIFAVS